jgi:hypothetical protein
MKRIIILLLALLLLTFVLISCAASRKNHDELRGLMLLENTQLGRNKAYYSKHNIKTRNEAYKKFKKNSRNL